MYVSWANDPPNPKIKDWNVTELKVREWCLARVGVWLRILNTFSDRLAQETRGQVDRGLFLEDA